MEEIIDSLGFRIVWLPNENESDFYCRFKKENSKAMVFFPELF